MSLITLTEHCGRPRGEYVPDSEWLELVGSRGWIAFTKDKHIGRLRSQRMAIVKFKVRCFYLTKQNLDTKEMAARFLNDLPRITKACARPGPFMFAVHKHRIQEMSIRVTPIPSRHR